MAKDFYDKLKILSDTLKEHKVLIFMLVAFLSSGLTNLGQLIASEDNETLKIATAKKNEMIKTIMTDQITVMAKTYVKIKKIIKDKPKTVTKYITKPANCEAVLRSILTEIDRKDLNHVNKLHR